MALNDCIAGTTVPVVTPNPVTPTTPPGTIVLTPGGPTVVVPTTGLGAHSYVSRGPGPSTWDPIVLPKVPTVGNMLVAVAFTYAAGAPAIGAGWTHVAAADHNGTVLDLDVRMAWKLVTAGPSASQTPFTAGAFATTTCMAIWEVSGLDASFTPSLLGVDVSTPTFGGSSVDIVSSYPSAKLYLFAGAGMVNSGDPGVGSIIGAFSIDDTNHVNGGAGGFSAHSPAITPAECGLDMGAAMHIGALMIALNVGGVVSGDGVAGTGTVPVGQFASVSLNGTAVSSNVRSLNVVGDVTLADDGVGNLTLTIPPGRGPYIDLTASETIASGALVSFWNSSGAKVRNADDADDTKQVDGFVLTGGASGATLRVYTGGVNDAVAGLTPGTIYFLNGTGGLTATPPTAAGKWLQEVGKAADATHLAFAPKTGTLL